MRKVPAKRTYVYFWETRIGRTSAIRMWWSKMVVAVAPRLVLVEFIIVLASVKLDFGFALAIAWILGTVTVLFLSTGVIAVLVSYRSASKLLGIRVNSKTFPPVDVSAYRAWCDRNGLVPFGALKSQAG
jgi:hypothetical protein